MSIFDTPPLVRNPIPAPPPIASFASQVERDIDSIESGAHGKMTLTAFGVPLTDLRELADCIVAETGYIIDIQPASLMTRWFINPNARSFTIHY